jgi:hypothetical protein
MISFFRILLMMAVISFPNLLSNAQETISLDTKQLQNSLDSIRIKEYENTARREYQFLSDRDFFLAYSEEFIFSLGKILKKISPPFKVNSDLEIHVIKCYYNVHAYSIWLITLVNSKNEHYIYYFESNSRVENIHLSGMVKDYNFIDKLSKLLFNIRAKKNPDHMIIAKIKGNQFASYQATQTFQIIDAEILYEFIRLLEMKTSDKK